MKIINKQQIEYVKLSDIKPHPENPRIHPDSFIDKLVKGIEEYGFTNPVIISEDGTILAGHARYKASHIAELEEIPAIRVPFDKDKADSYLIWDNRIQEESEWDMPQLTDILERLKEHDQEVELTGWDPHELEDMMPNLEYYDDISTEPEPDDAPEDFDEFDEDLETEYRCPKCHYEWSGKAK